ncbi:MAG: hypothetical protein HOL80_04620 [Candidatus Magasanikbacteria bacterium]|jgi:hypothetical protein|nr:hypothetical protein [Candidatus Magasanikbacteria bacterium]MBT5263144.1 hypothetical protein [Candidatus Magasanikbacteria bacterium]MBT5820057.1 hypothetical protein [Candidatus Magasanikbacteria bacterium]MBT6294660.1 hypothetical protein [Candidatus Magasanikbacteria bacterium]
MGKYLIEVSELPEDFFKEEYQRIRRKIFFFSLFGFSVCAGTTLGYLHNKTYVDILIFSFFFIQFVVIACVALLIQWYVHRRMQRLRRDPMVVDRFNEELSRKVLLHQRYGRFADDDEEERSES